MGELDVLCPLKIGVSKIRKDTVTHREKQTFTEKKILQFYLNVTYISNQKKVNVRLTRVVQCSKQPYPLVVFCTFSIVFLSRWSSVIPLPSTVASLWSIRLSVGGLFDV